jgi:sugar phosphate isomerase/epimerase
MPNEYVAFCDFEPEAVFEMAAAIGADTISALELLGNEQIPEDVTAAFHRLCEMAEPWGLKIALEAVPFTGIPDLATAWPMVENAPANGGFVIDAWHLFRGPDPDRDLDLLAAVPASRIFAVQINDAPREAWADLRAETMSERLLPGDGDQDLERFLGCIDTAKADLIIGPEVLSTEIWALSPGEAGRLLGESLRRVLPELGGGSGPRAT